MLRNSGGLIEPTSSSVGCSSLALHTDKQKESSNDRPACLENPPPRVCWPALLPVDFPYLWFCSVWKSVPYPSAGLLCRHPKAAEKRILVGQSTSAELVLQR